MPLNTKAETYLLEPQLKRQQIDKAFLLVNKGSFITAIAACGHVLHTDLPPRISVDVLAIWDDSCNRVCPLMLLSQ